VRAEESSAVREKAGEAQSEAKGQEARVMVRARRAKKPRPASRALRYHSSYCVCVVRDSEAQRGAKPKCVWVERHSRGKRVGRYVS